MKKAKGPAVQAGVAGFVRNWLAAGIVGAAVVGALSARADVTLGPGDTLDWNANTPAATEKITATGGTIIFNSDTQVDNNFYEPTIQMESTLKYLSALQAKREEVSIEMAYEKADRGEKSKRYDELSKRYQGINAALNGTLKGKHEKVGMVALQKSSELGAEYMRRENEIRVQEAMYKLLRQQSEQMRLEEAKMLTNLHVLEPPWENDKKVFPRRGIILMFTAFMSFLLATLLCNFLEFMRSEKEKNTGTSAEWANFVHGICFWRK